LQKYLWSGIPSQPINGRNLLMKSHALVFYQGGLGILDYLQQQDQEYACGVGVWAP
ncbi:hypothetical protein J1N35_018870, partial [Gossypium stocksii]